MMNFGKESLVTLLVHFVIGKDTVSVAVISNVCAKSNLLQSPGQKVSRAGQPATQIESKQACTNIVHLAKWRFCQLPLDGHK